MVKAPVPAAGEVDGADRRPLPREFDFRTGLFVIVALRWATVTDVPGLDCCYLGGKANDGDLSSARSRLRIRPW